MQVTRQRPSIFNHRLASIDAGVPIRFEAQFHQDMRLDDLFVVLDICSTYRPRGNDYDCKMGIANLRTGKLSYLDRGKRCRIVDCSVVVTE